MKSKSIPELLIWILYGLATGCGLFLTAMRFAVEYGYGTEVGMIAGAAALAILGLVTYIVSSFRSKKSSEVNTDYETNGRRWIAVAAESLVAVALMVAMVFLRIFFFTGGRFWNIAADADYTAALINNGQRIPQIAHGGREIYVHLLQLCMLLLGNKPLTAVVLQSVLLVIAALGIYCSVRQGAGRAAAVLAVVFLGFAPFMLKQTCAASSFLLLIAVYAPTLGSVFAVEEKDEETAVEILRCAVAGLLAGVCCYMDMAGITLLVFLTARICFGQKKEDKNIVLDYVVSVLCMAVGYMGCHALRGLCQDGMLASVNRQLALYAPENFAFPVVMPDSRLFLWDIPVIALLMAFGIFTFWTDGRIGRKAKWFFAAGVLLLMQCFGMNETTSFNAYGLLYLFCVVMAGMSVAELAEPKTVAAGVETAESAESAETAAPGPATDSAESAESAETAAPGPATDSAESAETAAPGPATDSAESAESAETAAPGPATDFAESVETAAPAPVAQPAAEVKKEIAQIQYIENPLPLPKKHERKIMDYDYEVADDDDFDIQ